jgi:hypothetical protein
MDTRCTLKASLKTLTLTSAGGLGQPEPLIVVTIISGIPIAVGSTQVPIIVVPGAAAHHTLSAYDQFPPLPLGITDTG